MILCTLLLSLSLIFICLIIFLFFLLLLPFQMPVEVRPNQIVHATWTPKLRLFKKDVLTGLKAEEVLPPAPGQSAQVIT